MFGDFYLCFPNLKNLTIWYHLPIITSKIMRYKFQPIPKALAKIDYNLAFPCHCCYHRPLKNFGFYVQWRTRNPIPKM